MIEISVLPKDFCRDFMQAKGNAGQIVMYMSLLLGYKPLLDDWIPKSRLREFKKVCHKHKIYVREDALFASIDKENIKNEILGKDLITTTSAYGFPLETDLEANVHVFLSKSKRLLSYGMWYPVIIKDRVMFQPRADLLSYGHILGYPECCIKFFRKYNDWQKYNYLYQIYKNSKRDKGYHFYCNPLLKEIVYSYIYHMPCSFCCKETIKLVNRLHRDIKKREPEFAAVIDRYLKLPFLVFYESKIYAFEGRITGKDEIRYSKVYFTSLNESNNLYEKLLSQGNRLKLLGRDIVIYKNTSIIDTIRVSFTSFACEYPYIIQFS
jgi:hypothetical protein